MEINEKFESDTLTKIIPALLKAQKEMENIDKDGEVNIQGRAPRKFATLGGILNTVKKSLFNNEISFTQPLMFINGELFLYTNLLHSSGEFIKSRVIMYKHENTLDQDFGKNVTYARRYAALCAVGCAPDEKDDDDGESQANKLGFIDDKELSILNKEFDGWPKLKALIMKNCRLDHLEDVKKSDFEGMMNAIIGVKAKQGTDK